jgi:dienelactone hydrolase
MKTRRDFLKDIGISGGFLFLSNNKAFSALHKNKKGNINKLKPTGAETGNLYQFIEALAKKSNFSLSFLTRKYQNIEEFKKLTREKFFELLYYKPEKVDFNPEVVERVDKGDYIREKVYFNTSPIFRVSAYVLIPKNVKGKLPAVIDLHSHGGFYQFGKEKVIESENEHPSLINYRKQNYDSQTDSVALVKSGYVVISIDAFYFGERRVIFDDDIELGKKPISELTVEEIRYLDKKARGEGETAVAKSLTLAGVTWPGIIVWDDIRTLDYLSTRPEVDPERIGCWGISMGGFRTTHLCGLDERIKCGVIVGFMSGYTHLLKAHILTHTWINYVPGFYKYLDFPDLASIMVPKPLMVQHCSQDNLFPLEGMKASSEKIAEVYRLNNASDKFESRFFDVPHMFSKEMQETALEWMKKWL